MSAIANPNPDLKAVNVYWPENFGKNDKYYGRMWEFEWAPVGLFSQIIVQCLKLPQWKLILWWRRGVLLEKDGDICILCLKQRTTSFQTYLSLNLRGHSTSTTIEASFSSMIAKLEPILRDRFQLNFNDYSPCPYCIKSFQSDLLERNTSICQGMPIAREKDSGILQFQSTMVL